METTKTFPILSRLLKPLLHALSVCALGVFIPAVSAATLEAHYPFEEGNGTTTEDLTGNHADATVIEDVAWSSETPQFVSASTQSLDLQANNAERGGVTLPASVSTGVLDVGPFSISVWARSHKFLDGNKWWNTQGGGHGQYSVLPFNIGPMTPGQHTFRLLLIKNDGTDKPFTPEIYSEISFEVTQTGA